MNKHSYKAPVLRMLPVAFEGAFLASGYDSDNLTEIFDIEDGTNL